MKLLTRLVAVSLAVTGFASPISDRAAAAISEVQLTNFKLYAEYAAAAYCNSGNVLGEPITCSDGGCPTAEANGAITTATLKGNATDIGGFVAVDPTARVIVVSYRGSVSTLNWLANLDFAPRSCTLVRGCAVHSGFLRAWEETSSAVQAAVADAAAENPGFRIITTGHSLGGAVATLAAGYLRGPAEAVDVYSYGSPRVGNGAFADFVTSQPGAEFRVTHVDDPVPRLPPALLGFRHTSPEYWLSTGNATTTDYAPRDVRVCQGGLNLECNGGSLGLDTDAHKYYLQDIDGCSTEETGSDGTDGTDDVDVEKLRVKVNTYAELDAQYAAGLKNESTAVA